MGKPVDRWLFAILALSILLRVAVALYLGDVVDAPSLLTDQRSYHALGARLITGHGFSFDKPWYPFTAAETPTAHWSFLYSLFVAGVYALFGVHPLAARLVQAVLGGALLPWAIFRLARRLFGLNAASATSPGPPDGKSVPGYVVPYVAAAVAAVYGYFVLYAATLMTETFYIVVVLWSLEISLDLVARLRRGAAVPVRIGLGLGGALGLAALLRQSILPWVPVLFAGVLWTAVRYRRTLVAVRVLALSGLLLLGFVLPWTYRNYRVFGEFLLLNSNTGYAMYSAQHPMHGTDFREFDAAPLPEGLGWGNEAVMDRELMRIGMQFVVDDPGRYLLLSLSRVRALLEFWPTPDTTLLHNVGRTGSYGLFLPFMLYGLFLAGRGTSYIFFVADHQSRWGPGFFRRQGLFFLFILVYVVMHVLTWSMVRYRLPVDAVMLPFAALALVDLAGRLGLVAAARGRREGITTPEFEPDIVLPTRHRES
jgi:hypothetical protein